MISRIPFPALTAGLAACGLVLTLPVHAQNELDALRYSQTQSTGTSRTQAMGGAGAALGADLGAFVLNPANVAGYRRSEFSFTPGLLLSSSSSATVGTPGSQPADNTGLNFANFGFVVAARRPDDDAGDWRSGNLGVNFSRINSFRANRTYSAVLPDPSYSFQEFLIKQFEDPVGYNANVSTFTDQFDSNNIIDFPSLAYASYLLNFEYDSLNHLTGRYYTPSYIGGGKQRETTEMRGAQNQIDIGYGASFRDKLYLGASLALNTLRYKQTRTLTETTDNPTADLKQLTLVDGYEVSGAGAALRIGAVFLPMDAIRIGVSVQTPTWYTELKEQDDKVVLSTVFNRLFPVGQIPNPDERVMTASSNMLANSYQYGVTTPFRATGGITLIGGKLGLVSADVDYVNYGAARLRPINNEPDEFGPTNQVIKSVYRSTVNYRVGGELRLANVFRLRAGYALYGSPYTNTSLKGERTVISAGAGLRFERAYVDLGLARTEYEQAYSPYSLDGKQPLVNTKYTLWNPTVTVGFTLQ